VGHPSAGMPGASSYFDGAGGGGKRSGDKLVAWLVRRTMTNLLAPAINCDDPDRAAKIIQDAFGIERRTTRPTTASRRNGRPTVSGATGISASGSRPRHISGLVTPAVAAPSRSPSLSPGWLEVAAGILSTQRRGNREGAG
jgi:hypothetical protein